VDDREAAALAAQYEQEAEVEQDPNRKLDLLSQLASLRAERLGDLEGAIAALRQALSAAPGDIQIMHQLATCLLRRAEAAAAAGTDDQAGGDQRRVAELFYRIAQGVEPAQAVEYLESALDSMPEHDGSLTMLEQLAPEHGREDALPARWVAFVSAAPEGQASDRRRILLGRAYLDAGQLDDAIACLGPPAEHGDRQAHQLLQEVYARQAHAPPTGGTETPAPSSPDAPQEPRLPTTRPPRARSEKEVAAEAQKIQTLRKRVQELIAARRDDEAAGLCREILDVDPNDPESFNLLESHYRKTRDYEKLRDLLLSSTRVPGLSVDARRVRLKEIAKLCEARLRDAPGAIAAWQGVIALDPADAEASQSLRRLLQKGERWDELAGVLERAILATKDTTEQQQALLELVRVHRDRRNDKVDTAEALQQLHRLTPRDTAVRDELCDLWLDLERWDDAVPLLEQRIATATHRQEEHRLLAVLAGVLDDRLGDGERAYACCEKILELRPDDADAFDRMERLDTAAQQWPRLLRTLERRVSQAPSAQKAALYARMGTLAEEKLNDLGKASEYLGEALDLRPDDTQTLEQLTGMFERAGRYTDLVDLLRERVLLEQDAKSRAALHRRMAQVLSQHLGATAGATEAYERLLEIEEDEAALRHLRVAAGSAGDDARLAELLDRLAAVVTDAEEKRDLWLERAAILHDRLGRGADAAATLERALTEADSRSEVAIERWLAITRELGDREGYARALGRRLELATGATTRVPLARELANVYENELGKPEAAIPVLQRWAVDEPKSPEPQRRLRALFAAREDWTALRTALDALGAWEDEIEAREEAMLAAARLTFDRLGDANDAWRRLEPMVREGHGAAEEALREVAKKAEREHHLAALYVRIAQESEDAQMQGRYWRSAALVFETALAQPSQALEASLRMLATDLSNRAFLDDVDRLAAACGAWPRLNQVYDRLLKDARDDADKVLLLRRHGEALAQQFPSEALDRVLRACALDPRDETLLERAEELAKTANRSEEMIVVYDRRRAKVESDEIKVDLMLRAARLSDTALRDRGRANSYLKLALGLAGREPAWAARVEQAARELDEASPELESARQALVRAHVEIAEHAPADVAGRLVLRASELSADQLQDERGAFEILRRGSTFLPGDAGIYERLLAMATRAKRLDALDAHLSRLIHDAIDSATTVILLERRARLLEDALGRPQDAADVYSKLLQLRPDDEAAAARLRKSLRRSGRHQELLLFVEKQLKRAIDAEARLDLLKDVAKTWERHLRNRWEATDAWKKILALAPDDAEATAALQRLAAGEMAAPEPDPRDLTVPPPGEAQPAPDVEISTGGPDPEPAIVEETTAAREERPVALTAATPDAAEPARDSEPAAPDTVATGDAESAISSVPAGEAMARDDRGAGDAVTADAPEVDAESTPGESEPGSGVEAASGPDTTADDLDSSAADDEVSEEGGLASLEADLAQSGGVEEIDILDAVEVEVASAVPARPAPPPPPFPGRASSPPPVPVRTSSAPPLVRTSAPPPVPPGTRTSSSPPLPAAASRGSSPPAIPGRASTPPPPVPVLPGGRAASRPPPLPRTSSPRADEPES
jgi:tetratricopeptide (TPR) repeat protein